VDCAPELEIPPTFASFTVEIPNTFALDRSVRRTGNVVVVIGVVVAVTGVVLVVAAGVVVALLGVVVAVVGAVVTMLGVELLALDQVERDFALKEMPELQAPNPFRFFARTRTL
jgi:hypothetical protein